MRVIADLQLHSKYARAVSRNMVIAKIWEWARVKGIGLIATGDWTHPLWLREIKNDLEEAGNGLLKLKKSARVNAQIDDMEISGSGKEIGDGPYFLLETEVSCIYSQGGKLRRIHTLIWAPSISSVEKINKKLMSMGANLMSDGRPIIGLTSKQVADVVMSVDSSALIIPAHVWTPWFSLYGSQSGFDSIEECFGDYSKYIYAIETGLSSSPAMNWRIKELDNRSILSFSDAHSGPKLGRESTVFELDELSYEGIRKIIMAPSKRQKEEEKGKKDKKEGIVYTIEFYPEEGKYHYTGHRNCGVKQNPEETRSKGAICPVCGKKLTVGVMHRVDQLAGRDEKELIMDKKAINGVTADMYYSSAYPQKNPYIMLVPLLEILAEAIGGLPTSKNVRNEYKKLIDYFGSEFEILLSADIAGLKKISGERVAEAVDRVRKGKIFVDPGFDGVFGKVKIWGEKTDEGKVKKKEQMSLF